MSKRFGVRISKLLDSAKSWHFIDILAAHEHYNLIIGWKKQPIDPVKIDPIGRSKITIARSIHRRLLEFHLDIVVWLSLSCRNCLIPRCSPRLMSDTRRSPIAKQYNTTHIFIRRFLSSLPALTCQSTPIDRSKDNNNQRAIISAVAIG